MLIRVWGTLRTRTGRHARGRLAVFRTRGVFEGPQAYAAYGDALHVLGTLVYGRDVLRVL